MKASDYIARFIEAQGVTTIFEMSGGMIAHLLDSFHQVTNVNIVSMHHEQSSAFAADAYGRVTGVAGVALATSGPGAANMLTGIASCYFDTVPAVFITGQVNGHERKGNRQVRQLGFQEMDIVSMARPVCKACYEVQAVEQLPAMLTEAFREALSGRPGPVLIDIPMNVQGSNLAVDESEPIARVTREHIESTLTLQQLEELGQAIRQAQRPLILVGRGVRAAGMTEQFRAFQQLVKVPAVGSLLGLDVLPAYEDPLRVGYIGAYGNRWANITLGNADLILVLGARLDIRQTGADVASFKGERPIYHVDCDEHEINNRVQGCVKMVADLQDFFAFAATYYQPADFAAPQQWLTTIREERLRWPDTKEQVDIQGINPNEFMHALSRPQLGAGYLADVGNHQQWAAQSLELTANQVFLTSGGMGSMGYALPAALGLCFANGQQPVVCIAGDGGFQMNIQELQTIAHHSLPIKMVVINNKSLGMIRQFQATYFKSRFHSTIWGYSAPDFVKVTAAYGIASQSINDPAELEAGVAWLWANPQEPALLEVMIDSTINCYPKLAFGRPITEMEPLAKPIAMEGT